MGEPIQKMAERGGGTLGAWGWGGERVGWGVKDGN